MPDHEIHLLFVCTGNTCRSPMAELLALHLLMESPPHGVKVHVSSAGTSATAGAAESPENLEALRAVGVTGLDGRLHRGRPLTPELIRAATTVYVMSASHQRHAQKLAAALGPQHVAKIVILDPAGHDVPDPVGRGPEVYLSTAQHLLPLVQKRLTEALASHQQPAPHIEGAAS